MLNVVPAVAFAGAVTEKCVAVAPSVTVSEACPDRVPDVAVIVTGFAELTTPVANPCDPAALLIVAVAVLDDAHVAVFVMSPMVPSPKKASALNCWVWPAAIVAVDGETEMLGIGSFPRVPIEKSPRSGSA